jgi:4-amino-4-deoxy-L-arabinose transferase-like glycosyltransferase
MWHTQFIGIINALLTLFTVVLGVVAFIHCATQRSDAFPAIGTLQKPAWLAIIGVATVMALLTNTRFLLFHMITIGAAALYLLDVRPGLKDATNGNGNW